MTVLGLGRVLGVVAGLGAVATGAALADDNRDGPVPTARQAGARPKGKTAPPKPKAGPLPFVPPLLTRLPGGVTVTVDEKGLAFKGDADAPRLEIGGRIHFDAGAGDLRPAGLGPALTDDAEIRRAWFEPTLILPGGVVANLQYDFASATQPVNNALLAWRGLQPVIVTVGNFKEPFSLDQLISNNNTLFAERSLLDAFAPGRDVGAAVGTHGERWTAVAGVFGGNINTDVARNGVAGTARITYAPLLSEHEVLHFGLAGSYRALDRNGTPLSFDSLPEDDLASTSLVDTGTLRGATAVGRLGLEALYQNGSSRVKAEYALTSVAVAGGAPARTFQAGYLEAASVLNGEGPEYELVPPHGSEYAVLGGVKVPDSLRVSNGGIGVFEIGARVSAITLDDGGVRGGTQVDGTLGLNWYPDRNIRLMADYVRAHADPAAVAVLPNGRADSDLFVGRLQFAW